MIDTPAFPGMRRLPRTKGSRCTETRIDTLQCGHCRGLVDTLAEHLAAARTPILARFPGLNCWACEEPIEAGDMVISSFDQWVHQSCD